MLRGLIRTVIVLPQAAIVTLLLLVIMVSLIEFADDSLHEPESIRLPDILMPETEVGQQRVIEKPEKPKADETPPPDIPQQDFERFEANVAVRPVAGAGRIEAQLELDIGAGLQATDGEYLPIVKVAPQYPRRALKRGIEGYVLLEYTVTRQGTVREPTVVEAEPEGVFDKAAMQSALRYKYKPRIMDGVPVEVPGVRTRIIFQIEKESLHRAMPDLPEYGKQCAFCFPFISDGLGLVAYGDTSLHRGYRRAL